MSTTVLSRPLSKPVSRQPVVTWTTPGSGRGVEALDEPGRQVLAGSTSTSRCAGPWPWVVSTTRQPSASQPRTSLDGALGVAAVAVGLALGEHDGVVLEVLVGGERRDRPPRQADRARRGRAPRRATCTRPRRGRPARRRRRPPSPRTPRGTPGWCARGRGRGCGSARGRRAGRWCPAGSTSTSSTRSSTSTGASASMPSTGVPSAIWSQMSSSSGCVSPGPRRGPRTSGGEQQLAARRRPQPVLGRPRGERWSATLNQRTSSTVSPQNSTRTGCSSVGGKTSTMPPRTANSPRFSTRSTRAYARSTSRRTTSSGSTSWPCRARPARGRRARAPAAAAASGRGRRRRHRAGGRVVGRRVGEPAQHREPPPDGVGARREPLVRQRLPRGEQRDPVAVDDAAERRDEVLGLAAGGGDGEHRAAGARGERRDHERPQPGRRGEVERARAAARRPRARARARGRRRRRRAGRAADRRSAPGRRRERRRSGSPPGQASRAGTGGSPHGGGPGGAPSVRPGARPGPAPRQRSPSPV